MYDDPFSGQAHLCVHTSYVYPFGVIFMKVGLKSTIQLMYLKGRESIR